MKAITHNRYGSSDVLRLDEVVTPAPGADEVLVRVHAAGAGPEVWHVVTGRPCFVRLMGFGVRAPKQRVPGRDLAGAVEAVGSAVSEFQPGDEVFGSGRGALAESCGKTPDDAQGAVDMTTATQVGQAGLQGWRAKVADGIAKPVADHTKLNEDQVRAVVGAAFFILAVIYIANSVRALARQPR